MNTVNRMISMPKRRMPIAKAVAGGFSARLVARWPSAVLPPVRQMRIVAVPLITEVPANTALDAPAGFSAPDAASLALLFGWIGFPGQQRLIDVEIAAFQQARIGGNKIAGDQFDDVAGHQLLGRHRDARAIAANRRLHRHRAAQCLDRVLRPHLLHEVERDAEHHDGDDDDEARDIAGRRGQRRSPRSG